MLVQVIEPTEFTPEGTYEGEGADWPSLGLAEQLPDEQLVLAGDRTVPRVFVFEKIITELRDVRQTLYGSVEITCVTTVAKAAHPLKKE